MPNRELPYNPSSKESILAYARRLVGSTLREQDIEEALDDIQRRKGAFGDAVEHYFLLENNSISEPDFKDAKLELKTTPLKQRKDKSLASKERLVLGMIDYMTVVDETFETSHLMEKAEDILLISYLWVPEADPLDYTIELAEMVSLSALPKEDLKQIKQDWEAVVDKVRDGKAHEISSSDTLYLEACTKAADASKRRKQPFSDKKAKPRAWALKASYMTAMSNRLMGGTESIKRTASEMSLSLLDLVHERFKPYFGMTERELGSLFGYVKPGKAIPKNLCALVTRHVLGITQEAKIEEFEKAGIVPKTIRVKRNGTPKESVSFPRFDYFELAATPFEKSDFSEQLAQKYLFVIYWEDDAGNFRLHDVAFWQMPDGDLDDARACYEEMRRRVINGRAQDSVKSSENRCCHVRPHGRNAKDTLPTPQGNPVVKKCFWLNAQYLKTEIARILQHA